MDPFDIWPNIIVPWNPNSDCPSNITILAQIAAISAPLAGTGILDTLPRSDSMPFQHCLWNCRMVGRVGVPAAKVNSLLKEMMDLQICNIRKTMPLHCFASMGPKARLAIVGACCSAFQPSDFTDNAAGRRCGQMGCARFPITSHSCTGCCANIEGIAPNTPDGPGTTRPCGPHMPPFMENLPGANTPL